MTENIIKIHKKESTKGDDGYKIFSVRVKRETVNALDELARRTRRSRNELINLLLTYGVEHVEIDE